VKTLSDPARRAVDFDPIRTSVKRMRQRARPSISLNTDTPRTSRTEFHTWKLLAPDPSQARRRLRHPSGYRGTAPPPQDDDRGVPEVDVRRLTVQAGQDRQGTSPIREQLRQRLVVVALPPRTGGDCRRRVLGRRPRSDRDRAECYRAASGPEFPRDLPNEMSAGTRGRKLRP
jgi:hypothetical protein